MSVEKNSGHSIVDATRSRARFSGHGKALGAAGFISPYDESQDASFLSQSGETAIINPREGGFEDFTIATAWDELSEKNTNFFTRLIRKTRKKGVDLDLGCLYELQNGQKGAIQAFGKQFGALDAPPFIALSGDERTGESAGNDEAITVKGAQWPQIGRLLVYIYIYEGADNWESVQPQIQVHVPGEDPLVVTLHARRNELALCAVASLENVRNGIRLTNHMEYYPGHAEMDRAFGFGLEWDEGVKSTL